MNDFSTSWPLHNDSSAKYAWADAAFSKEECEAIIDTYKPLCIKSGLVGTDNPKSPVQNGSIRDSKIEWLFPSNDTEWIFRRIVDVIRYTNDKYYRFHLSSLSEGIQFSLYQAPSGHYGFHQDTMYNGILRKLSISIQLSDPALYEGGDLEVQCGPHPDTCPREQGSATVFPSYTLHRVTPVTSGERCSLVCWVTGDAFK
jgi:PKHD-type hydroxylase